MSLIQIIAGLFTVLFSSAVGYYFALRKTRGDVKTTAEGDMVKCVTELERQLGIVGAQVAPFNTAFQSMLIKQLTHFHTPVMDALMVKLGGPGVPPTITPAEEIELVAALKKRAADPDIDEYEAAAAKALPFVMKMAKIEAQGKAKLVDIQVVGRLDRGEE